MGNFFLTFSLCHKGETNCLLDVGIPQKSFGCIVQNKDSCRPTNPNNINHQSPSWAIRRKSQVNQMINRARIHVAKKKKKSQNSITETLKRKSSSASLLKKKTITCSTQAEQITPQLQERNETPAVAREQDEWTERSNLGLEATDNHERRWQCIIKQVRSQKCRRTIGPSPIRCYGPG